MTATIIRLAERGRPYRAHPVSRHDFETDYREAVERVFAKGLRRADDGTAPSDTEPSGAA